MNVTLTRIKQETSTVATFYFQTESPLNYTAGQFIELRLPHQSPDSRGETRWFTLSSAPSSGDITVTTKLDQYQPSSFKKALFDTPIGTQFSMSSPLGDFILPKDASIPLVFVAGGIGCTPFHSIISELQITGQSPSITLLYSAKTPEDILFKRTFDQLGTNARYLTDHRLTVEDILPTITSDRTHTYLSGPQPMIESLSQELRNQGIQSLRIHTDSFSGYSQI